MIPTPLTRSFAALALALASSCAAIVTGIRDEVTINATPYKGTTLVVDGLPQPLGAPLSLSKRTRHVVLRNKAYGERVVPMARKVMAGYIVLDVLVTPGFGLVGLLVDGPTGAWYELPDQFSYDFETETARHRFGTEIVRKAL